ncbi:DUF2207 domain-containing protein [soil metagenome]
MKKVVGSLVAVAVLFGILLLPVFFIWVGNQSEAASGAGGDVPEPTTITDYLGKFHLAADGHLAVTETLTVSFPTYTSRHGIFRFWDRYDATDDHVRRDVEDVAVTLDEQPVQFEMLTEQHGRFDVAKIGSPDSFVSPGEHTYVITYTMADAIEDGFDGADSSFYWDVIPAGWAQDIERAKVVVTLPAPAQGVRCGVGLSADPPPCDSVTGEGTTTLVVTSDGLSDHTPITLRAGLDVPTPTPAHRLPWTAKYDPAFGTSTALLVVIGIAAVLAALAGALVARRARETDPPFPLQYAPPEGIGPAQAELVLTETSTRMGYVASLMHAAEHGAIDLAKTGKAWTITDKGGADGWQDLDPVTLSVAHLLGGPGTSFTADPDSVPAGLRLKTETEAFAAGVKSWGRDSGTLVPIPLGTIMGWLALVGLVAPIAIAIWNPFEVTMLGLVPGAFGIFAITLLRTGSTTKRTPQGRELWSRLGGFKRILATPSAVDRFEFSGRESLYTAYVPWAVAFGCADQWADKFRTEMGYEPPTPSYFGPSYYGGAALMSSVDSFAADFDSTVGSAISSYNATQSSSSGGGGGGFSGGGGGGGGGGGSW